MKLCAACALVFHTSEIGGVQPDPDCECARPDCGCRKEKK